MRAWIIAAAALVAPAAALAQSIYIRDVTCERGTICRVPLQNTGTGTTPAWVTTYTGKSTDTAIPGRDYTGAAQQVSILPGQTLYLAVPTMPGAGASVTVSTVAVVNRGGTLRDGQGKLVINPPVVVTPPPPAPVVCPDGSSVVPPATCPVIMPPPVTGPNINVDARQCGESAGPCKVSLWRTGDLSKPSSFTWATTNAGTATAGKDFTPVSGSGSIPAGAQGFTFTIPVAPDLDVEGNETIDVAMTATVNAVFGMVEDMTIVDDDVAAPPPVTNPPPAPGPVVDNTTPTPPPVGSTQVRAVSACKAVFPTGSTAPDANGLTWPTYSTLAIGDVFDVLAKGWTHDTKLFTSVAAGTFLSTCFG